MVRENTSGSDDVDRNTTDADVTIDNVNHHLNVISNGGRRGRRYNSSGGGRRHHHSSGNDVIPSSPLPPPLGTPSPTQLNIVWQGLPPNYQIAPDQLFVLSGPALNEDNSEGYVLEAHPVPRGATVLATPAVTAPVLPNGGEITIRLRSEDEDAEAAIEGGPEEECMEEEATSAGTNPDAPPFYPKDVDEGDDKENNNNLNKAAIIRQPSVMVWNSFFPSGKEFPLRQTQPPVYFHTQVSGGPNEGGESAEEPLLNGEAEMQHQQ